MGSVWRAQRIDGRFEGSVAIKLLNLALIGREGDERFKREGSLAIWKRWSEKLPNNPFVLRQLSTEAAGATR